jgi:predicted ATPase
MTATAFLARVVLRNYKSIATCDVALGPLSYLVGANGSGKSNFVALLRFVWARVPTRLVHTEAVAAGWGWNGEAGR